MVKCSTIKVSSKKVQNILEKLGHKKKVKFLFDNVPILKIGDDGYFIPIVKNSLRVYEMSDWIRDTVLIMSRMKFNERKYRDIVSGIFLYDRLLWVKIRGRGCYRLEDITNSEESPLTFYQYISSTIDNPTKYKVNKKLDDTVCLRVNANYI